MSVCNSSFSTHTANVPYQPCSYVLCPFTQMPVCSYGEKEQLLDSVSMSPQSTLSNISISVCDRASVAKGCNIRAATMICKQQRSSAKDSKNYKLVVHVFFNWEVNNLATYLQASL